MATVAQHSPSFSAFSPLLQEQALRHWQRLLALAPQYDALPEPTRQTLLTLLGLSDFVADSLIKQPGLLAETLASDALTGPSAGPPMNLSSQPCSPRSRTRRRSSASCVSSAAAACW